MIAIPYNSDYFHSVEVDGEILSRSGVLVHPR